MSYPQLGVDVDNINPELPDEPMDDEVVLHLLDEITTKDGRTGKLIEFGEGEYRFKLRDGDNTFWIKESDIV